MNGRKQKAGAEKMRAKPNQVENKGAVRKSSIPKVGSLKLIINKKTVRST